MAHRGVNIEELKYKAKNFPSSPGVYIMKNASGRVIYVGKAKSLRNRTSAYFSGAKDGKTWFLVDQAADIEIILTANEYEALLLENNLIKRYSPRYNINLKDGKSYPVIRITAEAFPRVFRTRRIIKDGSVYFGPYANVQAVDTYIDLIHKIYPLRRCKTLHKRENPCLYHHIDRCPAPCVGKVTEEEYGQILKKVKALLAGRTVGFRKDLEKQMREAAAELAFERAALLRDALTSLDVMNAEPKNMDLRGEAQDYVDYAFSGRQMVFAVMSMRGGQIVDRMLYANEYAGTVGESLGEFLVQFYSETGRERPGRLLVPDHPGRLVARFFAEGEGASPAIQTPVGKKDLAVQAMVKQNATAELDRLLRERGKGPALEKLKRTLGLSELPRRIEGFDISQLQGKHTVASLILFVDGRPHRSGYRHYRIRSTGGKIDDYQSIAEVVARRYQRLQNEEAPLPNLIVVDGGRGQVSAAQKVLKSLGLELPLIGLAKRDEEIWFPDTAHPLRLPEGDSGLRLLQHVRDETHRFATAHNQRLRSKDITLTTLEGVPGIGPSRSAKLLLSFRSLEGIYSRTAEEIAKTAGVGTEVAETVREFLGRTLESREAGKASGERRSRRR